MNSEALAAFAARTDLAARANATLAVSANAALAVPANAALAVPANAALAVPANAAALATTAGLRRAGGSTHSKSRLDRRSPRRRWLALPQRRCRLAPRRPPSPWHPGRSGSPTAVVRRLASPPHGADLAVTTRRRNTSSPADSVLHFEPVPLIDMSQRSNRETAPMNNEGHGSALEIGALSRGQHRHMVHAAEQVIPWPHRPRPVHPRGRACNEF